MSLTTPTPTAAMVTPVLSTQFLPTATTCTENHLTMLANQANQIWMNAPVPVSGTTFSDCYPSQFMSSYLQSASGTTQPAFNPLVCPENYSTLGPFTSNYIACCPTGYSLAQPTVGQLSDRPAYGGTCYKPLPQGSPFVVTAYGTAGATATTTTFQATVTDALAYAIPIEGYGYGIAPISDASGIVTAPGKPAGTGSAQGSNAPSPCSTHTVVAAADPTFMPSYVMANAGDIVVFSFVAGNHTITQSEYDKPCNRLPNGIDSGYMGSNTYTSGTPAQVALTVNNSSPLWFSSQQVGECGYGKDMVFAVNPPSNQPITSFQAIARSHVNETSTHSGLSQTAKAAIIASSICGVILIISLISLFYLRHKRRSAVKKDGNDYVHDGKRDFVSRSSDNSNTPHDELHINTWNNALGVNPNQLPKPAVPPKDRRAQHRYSEPKEMPADMHQAVELYGSDAFAFASGEKEMGGPNRTGRPYSAASSFYDDDQIQSPPRAKKISLGPVRKASRTWRGQRPTRKPDSPTDNVPHRPAGFL